MSSPTPSSLLPIRALTLFHPPSLPTAASVQTLSTLAKSLQHALPNPLQTLRLSLSTPSIFSTPSTCLSFAQCNQSTLPFTHISLGTIHPHTPSSFRDPVFIVNLIASTTTAFISVSVTDNLGRIHAPSVTLAADVMRRLRHVEEGGTANIRFAALANVKPGCPFLPASYAPENEQACLPAMGVSAGPLLKDGISGFCERVEGLAKGLEESVRGISELAFDFCLLPEIGGEGGSVEKLREVCGGGEFCGGGGWVAAAGIVAAELGNVKVGRRVGFWGVMMPVAEDPELAEGVRIGELLAVSAVCGTGLDVVPVPGESTVEELERVIMDVAVMSVRLRGKPLTARLMPVPGKETGELTEFESPYLVNGKVVGIGTGSWGRNNWGNVAKLGAYGEMHEEGKS